eukprot:777363-Prorocentrum_minimum.AAC.1
MRETRRPVRETRQPGCESAACRTWWRRIRRCTACWARSTRCCDSVTCLGKKYSTGRAFQPQSALSGPAYHPWHPPEGCPPNKTRTGGRPSCKSSAQSAGSIPSTTH